ncbi:F-box protein HRT3 [Nakaseomyces bracarensis]|uniref:F-box protein HRT3 n=1 Tax=Nakaseomyces bracarensis TaxID=273131 RepID=A0ABR4NXI5_9SACH
MTTLQKQAKPELTPDDRMKEAMSLWEKGASKEQEGSLSDAIHYYRSALKVDHGVENMYRRKLFDEYKAQKQLEALRINDEGNASKKDVDGTDLSSSDNDVQLDPCWLLEMTPNDILLRIVEQVVFWSGESWVNLSLTCKAFNKLCFHNSHPFQTFADMIYKKQVYDRAELELNGIADISEVESKIWGNDKLKMLTERPFIKFQGLYISVVNVLRLGANDEGSLSLQKPIQILTYYRYFRFYKDGTCLRLLTTDEPSVIVKHFSKANKPKGSEVCQWAIGIDYNFGVLNIRRSNDKYDFHEQFIIKNRGRRKHHQLEWVKSVAVDREGTILENSLKNERSFNFSRVKSYKVE